MRVSLDFLRKKSNKKDILFKNIQIDCFLAFFIDTAKTLNLSIKEIKYSKVVHIQVVKNSSLFQLLLFCKHIHMYILF